MNERSFILGIIMANNRIKTKQKQILDAAITVFASKGYHIATMQDIANEADMAVGTIYNYFKNKDDVIVSLFNSKWEEFYEGFKTLEKLSIGEKEIFLKKTDYIFEFFKKDTSLVVILFIQMSNLIFTDDAPKGLKIVRSKIFNLIKEELENQFIQGKILFEGDLETLSHLYFGAVQAFLTKTLIMQGEIRNQDKDAFIEFVLNGMKFNFKEDKDEQ